MESNATLVANHGTTPALAILATTAFLLSLAWSLPTQWMVVRRLVTEIPASRLAGHVVVAMLASAVGGGLPVLYVCALGGLAARRSGLSDVWLERAFLQVLRDDWIQVGFVLGWIAVAWLSTSAVEALVLRRLWRGQGLTRSVWSVAWRANAVGYVGVVAVAVVLLRNP
jgi:hypothetical protein